MGSHIFRNRSRGRRKREFLLTVDVEALPGRAREDHVEKLIWGRFPDSGLEAGITQILQLGEAHGVPVTCFLDMTESHLYGDRIKEVGRFIHGSGHDLQLHLHPELLPEAYWTRLGFSKPNVTQEFYELDRCRAVMNDFAEDLRELKGEKNIAAYRAGSFRIGKNMLIAQKEAGISISSNLSYETFLNQGRTPLSSPEARLFMWDIGVWELPVTQVWQVGKWKVLALPMQVDPKMSFKRLFRIIDDSEIEGPVVIILHSWSLLQREKGSRRFAKPSEARLRKYERLLTQARKVFEPISMSEMASRLQAGHYSDREVMQFPVVDQAAVRGS